MFPYLLKKGLPQGVRGKYCGFTYRQSQRYVSFLPVIRLDNSLRRDLVGYRFPLPHSARIYILTRRYALLHMSHGVSRASIRSLPFLRVILHATNSTGIYPLSGTASRPFRVQPTALVGYGGHYMVTSPSVTK